jgi:hypothetical protein
MKKAEGKTDVMSVLIRLAKTLLMPPLSTNVACYKKKSWTKKYVIVIHTSRVGAKPLKKLVKLVHVPGRIFRISMPPQIYLCIITVWGTKQEHENFTLSITYFVKIKKIALGSFNRYGHFSAMEDIFVTNEDESLLNI